MIICMGSDEEHTLSAQAICRVANRVNPLFQERIEYFSATCFQDMQPLDTRVSFLGHGSRDVIRAVAKETTRNYQATAK